MPVPRNCQPSPYAANRNTGPEPITETKARDARTVGVQPMPERPPGALTARRISVDDAEPGRKDAGKY